MVGRVSTRLPFARVVGVYAAIVALYVFGFVHWLLFFRAGHMTFTAYDWPKERWLLDALAQGLDSGTIPFHLRVPPEYAQNFEQLVNGPEETNRLLALPELDLAPQVVLLRFLTPAQFVVTNVLFLYSLGFVGTLWLKKRWRLSLFAFAVFVLLFNMNGHVVSHLAVGHGAWCAYFLLPFFVVRVVDLFEGHGVVARRAPLDIALFLAVLALQGAVHMLVWCALFLAIGVLFAGAAWRDAAIALGLAALLSAVRILPAAVAFYGVRPLAFFGGYPTLETLWTALWSAHGPDFAAIDNGSFSALRWWEFDLYVGALGVFLLAYFGVFKRFDSGMLEARFAFLDGPLVVQSLLSFSVLAMPLVRLPLPLAGSERVTSRFIVIPLVFLLAVACRRMDRAIAWAPPYASKAAIAMAFLAVEGLSLVVHSDLWGIERLEGHPGVHPLENVSLVEIADPPYAASLVVGAVISASAFAFWIALRRRTLGPHSVLPASHVPFVEFSAK